MYWAVGNFKTTRAEFGFHFSPLEPQKEEDISFYECIETNYQLSISTFEAVDGALNLSLFDEKKLFLAEKIADVINVQVREMTVEITQLTSEELRIMRTAFNIFDRNADNQIDQAEFGTLIRAIGFNASNHEIDEILRKFDKNKDGVIDFQEFISMAKHFEGCGRDEMEQNLRQAFRVFDRDGNGYISADELRYVVTSFGEVLSNEEAEELIAMFDKNNDGQLEYEEFVTWAKSSLAEYLKSLWLNECFLANCYNAAMGVHLLALILSQSFPSDKNNKRTSFRLMSSRHTVFTRISATALI